MKTSARHFADLAASAHQLQRAAGFFQQHASARDTVANLPVALAHVEEALDRLATGMTIAAHAVEEWPPHQNPGRDVQETPEARALRWHLFHLASRLKGTQESCVEPRRFARSLLEHQSLVGAPVGDIRDIGPPVGQRNVVELADDGHAVGNSSRTEKKR